MKQFVTNDGRRIASAEVADTYQISAVLNDRWQSEMVPFTARIQAKDIARNITMGSFSKEIFHDIRSIGITTIITLVAAHTQNGYAKYAGQDAYFLQRAHELIDGDLTSLGKNTLVTGNEAMTDVLRGDVRLFGDFLEMPPNIEKSECELCIYKYIFNQDGVDHIFYLAGEWECANISYLFRDMGNLGKITDVLKEKTSIDTSTGREFVDTLKDVVTGKEKMTMDDYMHGGIIGRMKRKKAENASAGPRAEQISPAPKEEERKGSHTLFGTQHLYYCLARADNEKEVLDEFLTFIGSVQFDPGLYELENRRINQKFSSIRQQVAINQQMAYQKQMQLRRMQAQTSQMIARNSAQASAGLMDSWNRRMASEDRISRSYSEAVRGVDTYTNSYGQSVDVSVAADHVYENRYGDVYGVSGAELDQSVLNDLDWKKLDE